MPPVAAAVWTGRMSPGRGHTDLRFQTRGHSLRHLPALSASFPSKAAFPRRIEEESVPASASQQVLFCWFLLIPFSLGNAIKN